MAAVAKISTINSDQLLLDSLGNPSPAVRYWAAKGLSNITERLEAVPGAAGRAKAAIRKAIDAETSAVVTQELVRASLPMKDPAILGAATKRFAANMTSDPPTPSDLAIVESTLTLAQPLITGAKFDPAVQKDLLEGTGHMLSLAAQHEALARGEAANRDEASAELRALFRAAAPVMNAAAGKTILNAPPPSGRQPVTAELLLLISNVAGTARDNGAVHKINPDVARPPRIAAQGAAGASTNGTGATTTGAATAPGTRTAPAPAPGR